MGRRSKKDLPPTMVRLVIGANVARLRDQRFTAGRSITARNKALAEKLKTSLSQVQRIVDGALGISVDQLEQLSSVLEVTPAFLVTPYAGFERGSGDTEETNARELQRQSGNGRT
jgi:transcriptional regulator with XRE-family HTH domain